MVASERYERDLRKAFSVMREDSEERILARVRAIFLSYLAHLPAPLGEELWMWYADRAGSGDERFSGVRELAVHLGAIIDMFDRAFDEDRTPLDEDEWELVRNLVNSVSPEMNMGILENVMQILMDHGSLG